MRQFMQWFSATLVIALLTLIWVTGHTQPAGAQATPDAGEVTEAVCVLTATEGNDAHGIVRLTQSGNEVTIEVQVMGLEPGGVHAIHIHEFGDISDPAGDAAGGHYNPEGHDHALPDTEMRHAGDLGNIEADDTGTANASITVHNITLAGAHNPVIGRAVIVHTGPDDGGQPTGNAGGRIAQGVIGIASSAD